MTPHTQGDLAKSDGCAGFLLAGGRSTRMGQDKALLRFEGETLVEQGLRKLQGVCTEVAIAGGDERLAAFGRVIPDGHPGCGPLSGIVAALGESSREWNLFCPVDLPLLPVEALQRILDAGLGGDALVTLAVSCGAVQPLVGLYSRRALPVLRRELEAGNRRVFGAAEAAGPIQYVYFPEETWFANANTPEEFERAKAAAGAAPGRASQHPTLE